ncbi:unnamed protein product [Allacma fusca]|uniref:Major facilitator superfamily (MFS) profile domain-containing protein n=1 Tax=Allacma fusca TaxID=39272 RepID=A0A8J2L915_9HEXA|nr:unnamed protein product [Allacma fusca]
MSSEIPEKTEQLKEVEPFKRKKSLPTDVEKGGSRKASFFIGDDKDAPVKIVGPDDEEIHPDEIIVAPDGGWGWVVAFASFLSNVVVDGIIFSFGLMSEPIRLSFEEAGIQNVTVSNIAWISSLLNGFYLLGGPFVSALANKFGFRVVAILGSVVGCLGFMAAYIMCRDTPNLYSLLIFYGIIGGIGFNLLYVPSVIAVGFYFEKYRALATGIAICGSGVGTFIFAPLTYYLVSNYGWRVTITVHAALVLSCSICGAMYRPVKALKERKSTTAIANDPDQEKKKITPFQTPEGTPLLMRIKRAREMEKWDSINSVENDTPDALTSQNRKASTHSLNNPLPIHKQAKRMSVPSSMVMIGDLPLVRTNTQSSVRGKGVIGDLVEIQEENEINEDDPLYEHSNKENTNQMNQSGPILQTKIGNSTYLVDEMTRSRILRVSSKNIINKALYRDDIFYSGSMRRIPEYAETVDKGHFSSVEWSAIVANKPQEPSSESLKPATPDGKKRKRCCTLSVVKKMLDFSLLASPTFVLLAVAGAFTMAGFFVPFIFLKGISMQAGVEESDAPMLISVIGIANTVGRVFCGWLADRPQVKAVVMNNAALTIGGISTILVPFLTNYWLFIGYSSVFGLAMACYVSLRSILLVDLLGLNKLTNAFGLLCLFQGAAAMFGAPLAGFLFDFTGNFDMTFYVAGGLILMSVTNHLVIRLANYEAEISRKEILTEWSNFEPDERTQY